MLIKYQRTYMSGERFLLITANFNCVFRESRDSKKTDRKEGWKKVFDARIE